VGDEGDGGGLVDNVDEDGKGDEEVEVEGEEEGDNEVSQGDSNDYYFLSSVAARCIHYHLSSNNGSISNSSVFVICNTHLQRTFPFVINILSAVLRSSYVSLNTPFISSPLVISLLRV
jgi:hypothetical protein